MTASELLKNLARLEKHRAPLYLSSEKMEHWFLQKVSQIVELGTGEVLSGKVEGSLFGLLKSEAGGQNATESKIGIDNAIVQCVVAENAARATNTLVDLSSAEPKMGELLYYAGPARITMMNETVSPETTYLTTGGCATVTALRKSQEFILKAFDPNAGTIVLTFTAKTRAFASIASLKSVVPNSLSRYYSQKNFGILGTLQSTEGGVAFLDPLWIWHEGAA